MLAGQLTISGSWLQVQKGPLALPCVRQKYGRRG